MASSGGLWGVMCSSDSVQYGSCRTDMQPNVGKNGGETTSRGWQAAPTTRAVMPSKHADSTAVHLIVTQKNLHDKPAANTHKSSAQAGGHARSMPHLGGGNAQSHCLTAALCSAAAIQPFDSAAPF